MINKFMQKKSLLLILYGEPRGIGNSPACPGSNQLDVIFENKEIYSSFESIKVLWYITDTTVAPDRPWDNTYMIDKNDQYWSCEKYLPTEQIMSNIHNHMVQYKSDTKDISYEIKIRTNHLHRWGLDYLDCIDYAIDGGYDRTIFHRPDSNIAIEYIEEEDDKRTLAVAFKDFLTKETDAPVVCLPKFTNGSMCELIETQTDYKKAYCIFWNTFEMMAWNKAGIKALRDIIKLKCDNLTLSEKYEQNEIYRGHPANYLHVENENLSIAENFWPITLNMLKIINPKFTVVDLLPWRSFIRTKTKDDPNSVRAVVKPFDVAKNLSPDTYIFNSRTHGYDVLNNEIQRLYDERGMILYWSPRVHVKRVYDNFCNHTYEDYSKIELRDILNLPKDYDLYNIFKETHTIEYNVSYNPDKSNHIPIERYYNNIFLESKDGNPIYNPAKVLMHYALHIWFNDFDFEHNLWDRPLTLYIDENKRWKLHPGSARTGYAQFSSTDTPMFLFVHKSHDNLKDIFGDEVKMFRVKNNLEDVIKAAQRKNGMKNPEFCLRITDDLCDAWYSDQEKNDSSHINTGERYNFYFGDTLRIKYDKGSLFYNDELVSFINPETDSLHFNNDWDGPVHKIAEKEFDMEKHIWPWDHYVVDDFLPEGMLKGLISLPVESDNTKCNGTRTNVTGRWFFRPDNTTHDGIQNWIVKFFRDNITKFEKQFGYDLSNSYMRIEVCKDDNGFFQERHLDTLEKRITMIVYLHKDDEDVDLGTDLFPDETSSQCKRAEWKVNRCLVFKPTEKTWHGFSPREFKGERRVLICNFVDKDQWESKDQVWDT